MNNLVHRFVPIDQIETEMLSALSACSQAESRFLRLLRQFDFRQGYKAYGNLDCASWLVWKCKLCRGTAAEKVRVARALWHLPKIDAAFAQGDLTYSQVRALTRVASKENEAALIKRALGSSADDLERYCSRLRNGSIDDAETLARRQREDRALTRQVRADGSGTLTVDLPAAEFELVMAALEKIGAALPDDPERSLFARGADALMALARGGLTASDGTDGYEVVVHVDATALSGAGGESDLPLPAVKRLCCDGSVRTMLTRDGTAIDLGRRQRTVSTALKRALQARDRTCRFPGCHHTRFVDAHHVVHWADGGETSLENLILLCSHHHTLIHESGYRIRRWQHGRWYFARPDGRVIDVGLGLSAESGTERYEGDVQSSSANESITRSAPSDAGVTP